MLIYNTLTRKKEEFIPIEGNKVNMYMCGPTVYNLIHVGNARPQIVFDTVRRYLIYRGYDVRFIQNFTDIDDKIINRAISEGTTSNEIAERYIKEALTDSDALGVKRADAYPRVTEEIPGIIDMIEVLQSNETAYEIGGTVYFDTAKINSYGKLSGKIIEELEAGARVEVDEGKKSPSDFVLWKPAKEGEPFWQSPWGNGRPGWHIECSVMVKKYLGSMIDIHCGGEDLMFPHHENEIAQSEAANGVPLSKYWIHNAMILVDNKKMSKSLGNFFILREAAEQYTYEVVRFFILSAHYRSPLNFSDSLLQAAQNSLSRIRNGYTELTEKANGNKTVELRESESDVLNKLSGFREAFLTHMDDDFNTANAITVIFDIVKYANINIDESSSQALASKYLEELKLYMGLLGISLDTGGRNDSINIDNDKINELLDLRKKAREAKDYGESDRIRDELLRMGIEIKDTREGVKWYRK